MPAGRMRDRVTLQRRDPDAPRNDYNERDDEWLDVLTSIPAEVYALTGNESQGASQVQSERTHRVTLRTPGNVSISPEHRFIWVEHLLNGTSSTHYFDIKQVTPLQQYRGYTQVMCVEHEDG